MRTSGKRGRKRKANYDENLQHAEDMSADNGLFDSPSPQLVTPQTQSGEGPKSKVELKKALVARRLAMLQNDDLNNVADNSDLNNVADNSDLNNVADNSDPKIYDYGTLTAAECMQKSPETVNLQEQSFQLQHETRAECSNVTQAMSFNLTDVQMLDDDSSTLDSNSTDALVTVNGYRVKRELAHVLRYILAMHGDIAAQCNKMSTDFRSLLVQNVCDLVQQLKTTKFVDLTKLEIERFQALVADIKMDNVNVGWLDQSLDEIHTAKSLLNEYRDVKQAKEQKKKEIKVYEDIICKLQEKIKVAHYEIEVKKAEKRQLDDIISHTKDQVRRFYDGSLTDGIL